MIASATGLAPAELAGLLDSGLAELRLVVGADARLKLVRYLVLLEKWNQVYNLTAVRDSSKAVSVHLLDCLAVAPYVTGVRVLDVGSGAGLPGIPLAAAMPELAVTLLDSNQKKAAFLNQAVAELPLKNANVIRERIESWQPEKRFDYIVSRAFSEIADFIALSQHLLAPGGVLAAMKGVYPFEEIERMPPDFRVRKVHKLSIPALVADRHLILIERA